MKLLCVYKDALQYKYSNEEEMDEHLAMVLASGRDIQVETRIYGSRPLFGSIVSK